MAERRSRAELIVQRLNDRLKAVCESVPPISPPAAHWLDSDAGPSYCWDCAVKARANEFGLGPPIRAANRWTAQTDLESAFYEGIDGDFDTTSDHTEACETCGRTLSYILTDYGVEEEIAYYREAPLCRVRAEDAYALDRLFLNVFSGSPRAQILGVAIAVNQAWRLLHGNIDRIAA